MSISWGYSPKIEKYIPLGDFPIDSYLLVARQAVENLGWKLSHISTKGMIAYTPISFQSYSEEISIKFENNFAIVKSECIGIQLLFNDYGKNQLNLDKFFHEFEYVEFHLQEIWDDSLAKLREFVSGQDPAYFEKAPLTIKNKIKNIFHLFIPQTGYLVTPILLYFNILYFLSYAVLAWLVSKVSMNAPQAEANFFELLQGFWAHVFANNRDFVYSGQVWRLFTYQFVHLNFLHLFFNMYSLVYIGLMTEHKLGSRSFALIYLISAFCGGLASILMHDVGYGIGASGPIMGLFGAFIALLLSNSFEKNATKALLLSTVIVSAITLIGGISGNADNAAHIGGFIGGLMLTYGLVNPKIGKVELSLTWRRSILGLLLLIFSVTVFFTASNSHARQFSRLVEEFEENSKGYVKVSEVSNAGSTLQRMKMAREYGMDLWERNAYIVTQMRQLKLDANDKKKLDYYMKVTALTQRVEYMRYRFIQTKNPQAKKRFDEFGLALAEMSRNAKQDAGLDFPQPGPIK